MIFTDVTITKNIWNVTFVMNTNGEYTSMTDITTMDFQSVVIMHAMNVMTLCLVHLDQATFLSSERAYEDILEVINDKTYNIESETATTTIDYYEAARIAYTEREYMKKFIECEINVEEINKRFRPLWEFTYRIVSGEAKERVRVVNKDPDNLLVQWVPGGKTVTEILEDLRVKHVRM